MRQDFPYLSLIASSKDRAKQHLHTITANTREDTLNEKNMYMMRFFCLSLLSPKNYASRFIWECVKIIHPWDLHDNVCMSCFALSSRIPPIIMLQFDKDLMNPGEPHENYVILYLIKLNSYLPKVVSGVSDTNEIFFWITEHFLM